MKSSFLKLNILIITCLLLFSKGFAQCPTVDNNSQVLCNIESLLVSDLEAIDNGSGVAWFDTATSTTPLNSSLSLVDGENYFADNSSGNCGSRQEVTVTILGAPIGLNFQGVCVEDQLDATIADLEVTGNDVQWYLSAIGGSPLDMSTVLLDETIYYADQSNPTSNCRTSRLAVFVIVGIVPAPQGDIIQQFCANNDNIPTVGDLVASGNNNWYLSESSASPLDLNTPLIDGNTYFATIIDPPCESESRLIVTVEIIFQNSAGTNGALEICEDDTIIYDLFDSLNGSPDTGGTWSPALNSGTGIFDPALDTEGTYTYTVASNNVLCEDASATVTVSIIPPPNAGTDGTLEICENDTNTYDLFDSLNGSPDSGGAWTPALNSGTGIFDPALDTQGTYTYTVASSNPICNSVSASVIVSFETPPNPGSDGALEICEDDTTIYDLFDSLNGSPDTGGTWSPALNSGTGIFDPTLDAEGTYTYTVASNNVLCEDASATVIVSIIPPPNAGTDGTLEICENDTNTYDLFDSLNGSPDSSGAWTPALNSGTGIFDPAIDAQGTYTYTVEQNDCMQVDSSEVLIILIDVPDLGGLLITVPDTCQGTDLLVSISNASELLDGDYSITFNITGANSIDQNIILSILNGEGTFLINSDLFVNDGLHQLIINSISSVSTNCDGDVSNLLVTDFIISESITPLLIEEGNSFCIDEYPTITSLSASISNADGLILEWYDAFEGGNVYDSETLLENEITYYASIVSDEGCESFIRLEVTVNITDCTEDIIIPDGFSPNNDGINETFNIINLDILYPNFKITIFNRYGNKLYQGNINSPKWDGTSSSGRSFGDNQLPVGVYLFILEFNDGIREQLQGRVYLNR